MSRLNVRLYRDSFKTPWGFRLQGGRDLNQPLTVQRVFSNSPAEGELQRGDTILSIGNQDATQLTHKQAQDLIQHSGGQVQLLVQRPPPGAVQLSPLSPPVVTPRPRAPSLQPSSHKISSQTTYKTMYSSHSQQTPVYVEVRRERTSYSQPPVTPTTPTPPWAANQPQPKRVSKLSKLGGTGGLSFGTDYCTLPRRHPGAQVHYGRQASTADRIDREQQEQEMEADRLASGPPPRVCRLSQLGGGGYSFGSSFGNSTLPRNSSRRSSQPVGAPRGQNYGFSPSKVNLSRLGGGGPEFGSDFSRGAQTPAQRVQTSLDNITLSPRTPEAYQPDSYFSQQPSQQYQPDPYYSQPPAQHVQAPPPQQMYTPTGLLLEQQRMQEQQQDEGETIVPVWERRRQFQDPVHQVRTPVNKPAPKIPKPKPGPSSYTQFGTDYSKPQSKQSVAQWQPSQQYQPQPVQVQQEYQPQPVMVQQQYQPRPVPVQQEQYRPPPTQQVNLPGPDDDQPEGVPAWRNTLRSTGVKPWDKDVNYVPEQPAARSVPYQASNVAPKAQQFNPTPANAPSTPDGGPRVVHLQYNSPMSLYSNQNIKETLDGQTQALKNQSPQGGGQANQSGDRDWSQSAVLRFIEQDKRRKPAPTTAPKPQPQYHQQHSFNDEYGSSSF